ncbi:XRE family transcriptional regulator [Rhodoblastus acidophilus]|nr:XRE family transcriptional regulator [Rhodoblastus acidophilus]RAI20016.1 XRE family transcriptional regulator [Rhodoblastus acidophilus]
MKRLAAGLDQLTFAEQLNTTGQRIREFEAGLARVDPQTMRSICRLLNLSVSYFFEPWMGRSESNVAACSAAE